MTCRADPFAGLSIWRRPIIRRLRSVGVNGYLLGTPNVWAGFTVDQERGLIFLPTGNPAPDYFRDDGPDRSYYGSSLVALDGASGQFAGTSSSCIGIFGILIPPPRLFF